MVKLCLGSAFPWLVSVVGPKYSPSLNYLSRAPDIAAVSTILNVFSYYKLGVIGSLENYFKYASLFLSLAMCWAKGHFTKLIQESYENA